MNSQIQSSGANETTPPVTAERWRPNANPWLIAVVVAMAAFMEVLDTSIANVALPHMAGSLSASNDESTWILTSYLASNAIVLPITGWFAGLVGRKRFFRVCLAVFTLSSLLCGISPNLGASIVFRILQGAGGGRLQPMAQAILADTFPPEKRGVASLSMASPQWSVRSSDPSWGAGLQTTTVGAGFSSSIFQWAFLRRP
jgi:DHA2 family multidrug resistance protein